MKKRDLRADGAVDASSISAMQNNVASGGQKNLPVGPVFKAAGLALNTEQVVHTGDCLYIYNNAAAVGWVTLYTGATPAAPSSFATGIPCAPNSWTVIGAGLNTKILGSAATLGLYVLEDDTTLRDV